MAKGKKSGKEISIPDYVSCKSTGEQLLEDSAILMALAHDYDRCQLVRMMFDNQLSAWRRRQTKIPVLSTFIAYRDQMAVLEKSIYAHACLFLLRHPVCEWLFGIPGMGVVTALKLLAFIPMREEKDFVTVSKLYKYCGLLPGYNKRIAGQKLCYNPRVKLALYNFWRACLLNEKKIRSRPKDMLPPKLYIDTYHKWLQIYITRQEYKPKADRWPMLRCKYAAKNKMLTLFVSHLWLVWREALGYRTKRPYVHDVLGHNTYYSHVEYSSWEWYLRQTKSMKAEVKRLLRSRKFRQIFKNIGKLEGKDVQFINAEQGNGEISTSGNGTAH